MSQQHTKSDDQCRVALFERRSAGNRSTGIPGEELTSLIKVFPPFLSAVSSTCQGIGELGITAGELLPPVLLVCHPPAHVSLMRVLQLTHFTLFPLEKHEVTLKVDISGSQRSHALEVPVSLHCLFVQTRELVQM